MQVHPLTLRNDGTYSRIRRMEAHQTEQEAVQGKHLTDL